MHLPFVDRPSRNHCSLLDVAVCRRQLKDVFDRIVRVEPIESGDTARLDLLGRPELGITFTKLRVWTLTEYTKCVFLDADTIVIKNIDDLFDKYVT